jgi:protein-S-isoprenylcysteine O-methyltransferase Ste14
LAPFFLICSNLLAIADDPFDVLLVISLTGVALFIFAIRLLHASRRDLGAAWTPRSAPAEGDVLITDSIYAVRQQRVRNTCPRVSLFRFLLDSYLLT